MKKRFLCSALALTITAPMLLGIAGCASDAKNPKVLRVYNWEDYISEPDENDAESEYLDLIGEFEKEYGVTVEYSTFGTNENMYNELKINPDGYDLVCPSDYMIMKMINENMVEPFSESFLKDGEYAKYASPYITKLFADNGWTNYAAAYMWGTMGYVYNPNFSDNIKEDLSYWGGLWKDEYRGKSTIKDSVRDSYFLGVAYVYAEELISLRNDYENGNLTVESYNEKLTEIMNRTDEKTVDKVTDAFLDLKQYLYGFEVDSGKQDMITGKIAINFAWSGDAVYAMDEAEPYTDEKGVHHDGIYLNYIVPEECSNIWFDGWVMPKGANVDLAEKFINFLSRPVNAAANMNFIGYTSAVAGDAVFDEMTDWYSEGEEGDLDENGKPLVPYDLNYFFRGTGEYDDYKIWISEDSLDRQIAAQYPSKEVVDRSAIMQTFDRETNDRINDMWEHVKSLPIPIWAYVVIAVIAAGIVVIAVAFTYKGKRRAHKPKKGYKPSKTPLR